MPNSSLLPDIAAAITAAAARPLPILEIPQEVGLTMEQWAALLDNHRELVRVAVAQGRLQAELRIRAKLATAVRYRKVDVVLFQLQRDYGWPRPRRGRPRR